MRRGAATALVALGLSQMLGDLLGFAPLRGLAAATAAAPAPKVFSSVRGLETFSTRFHLEWRDPSGAPRAIELTPEAYAGLRGPYNRRNAYGAVIAYGPVLAVDSRTAPLLAHVARYALCGDAPLLRELGVDPAEVAGSLTVRLAPLPASEVGDLPLRFEPPCPE